MYVKRVETQNLKSQDYYLKYILKPQFYKEWQGL